MMRVAAFTLRTMLSGSGLSVSAFLALSSLVALSAGAVCLDPPGDVSGDGVTTVIDVQCNIVVNLWFLGGQVTPVPTCLSEVGDPLVTPDHNCDGIVNVSDTILAVSFALGVELPSALDPNGNQCVEACETDLDGDGDFDFTDCAPTQASIGAGNPEVCNGYDDDCDGLIDEGTASACSDANVCNGVESCPAPPASGVVISEFLANPDAVSDFAGEWVELTNFGAEAVNIDGWTVQTETGSHQIAPGGALFIPRAGTVVLGASADLLANGGVLVTYQYAGIVLSDTDGIIRILDSGGGEVDSVDYGPGWPLTSGASTALADNLSDNTAPSAWAASTVAFGLGDAGTPKSPNFDVLAVGCQAASPLECDDGDACTADTCDPASGCATTPVVCESTGDCAELECDSELGCIAVGGTGDCDDENPCTQEFCDPVAGCIYDVSSSFGVQCDDGDACTFPDVCGFDGACAPGFPVVCTDDSDCTLDSCDSTAGCLFVEDPTDPCDDGISCTVDSCGSTGCQFLPSDAFCGDDTVCADNSCDPSSPLAAASGCVAFPQFGAECDDGDECTFPDVCGFDGLCASGFPVVCDDGSDCTADSCDSEAGCTFQLVVGAMCTDGIDCTTDSCQANGSCLSVPSDAACDDANACTIESCAPGVPGVGSSGCLVDVSSNFGVQCDDGDACTFPDVCGFDGTCVPGFVANCDDADPCTIDSCASDGTGCAYQPFLGGCDDGVECTAGDSCASGTCAGTPDEAFCDDGLPCTLNACAPADASADAQGCVVDSASQFGLQCEDGDPCTFPDVCGFGGACEPGFPSCGCGDGSVDVGEECDDGNTVDDDGCTAECLVAPCDEGGASEPGATEVCNGIEDVCGGGVDFNCAACNSELFGRFVSSAVDLGEDFETGVAVDASGGFVVTGTQFNSGGVAFGIANRYGVDGEAIWSVSGTGPSQFSDVAALPGGDVIVVGWLQGGASRDAYYARLAAADGSVVWSEAVDVSGDDDGIHAVVLDDLGRAVVQGTAGTAGAMRRWIRVIDPADGSAFWSWTSPAGVPAMGTGVATAADGTVYAVGTVNPGTAGSFGVWTTHDALDGSVTNTQSAPSGSALFDAALVSGQLVVGGSAGTLLARAGWVAGYDPAGGSPFWESTLDYGFGFGEVRALVPSPLGKIAVAGTFDGEFDPSAFAGFLPLGGGELQAESTHKFSSASGVGFGPSGRRYVSGASDWSEWSETSVSALSVRAYAKDCAAADPGDRVRVFLLAGQSNMVGFGFNSEIGPELLDQPDVQLYWESVGSITNLQPASGVGGGTRFGPEIQFGRDLRQAYPGDRILLVKYAVGGTNLHTQWNPGATPGAPDTGPLYTIFVNTVNDALAAVQAQGQVPVIEGMIWMQGESDGGSVGNAENYDENLIEFITRVREDVGVPDMPFVIGEIFAPTVAFREIVKANQQLVAATLHNTSIVDTDDLPLTDSIHYDTFGTRTLGARYAAEILAHRSEPVPPPPPPPAVIDSLFLLAPESTGYELVYELPVGNSVDYDDPEDAAADYSVDESASWPTGSFDRVAYLMTLEHPILGSFYTWASMDTFSANVTEIGVPVDLLIQTQVSQMNVYSDHPDVAPALGAADGNIEFWGNNYTFAGALGLGGDDTVFDFDDTPTIPNGYGSWQIHRGGVPVFVYNAWGTSGGELGIGFGPGVHPDWTFTSNAAEYTDKLIRVYVQPSTPPGVADASGYSRALALTVPDNANWDVDSQIAYETDNRAALASLPFSRIAYYVELASSVSDEPTWVWVSMDAFTPSIDEVGVPVDAVFQQSVSNLTVETNSPALTNVVNASGGSVEFWSDCYSTDPTELYDAVDTPTTTDCYGSMQVHLSGSNVFSFNRWSSGGAGIDVGIGPNAAGPHPDWTFSTNAGTYEVRRIEVFVQ